jgi:hypothetical protein
LSFAGESITTASLHTGRSIRTVQFLRRYPTLPEGIAQLRISRCLTVATSLSFCCNPHRLQQLSMPTYRST